MVLFNYLEVKGFKVDYLMCFLTLNPFGLSIEIKKKFISAYGIGFLEMDKPFCAIFFDFFSISPILELVPANNRYNPSEF